MRYFKYKNAKKNMDNALKEQYLTLTKNEKRTVRRERLWQRCSSIFAFIIFFACMFASAYLLKIIPHPSNQWLEVLVVLGKAIGGFVLLIVSGLLTYGITYPLWKKVESFNIPLMKKEIFSKACGHLRDYYGLQEPCIITKCYDSTDENFKKHDVCIFVVNDELRITTDLIHGFLHGHRDLGCYVFTRDEIVISKKHENNLFIAELKAEDTIFLLGYRAKRFIENSFLSSEKDT